MKKYIWRGVTYQIAEEDLWKYPGAVPVHPEKPAAPEKKAEPKKKAKAPAKNKSRQKKPENK